MVAILHCDWQLEVQLSGLVGGDDTASYSEARRRHEWKGTGPHLAVLVAEGEIRWLGRVVGGSIITTRDRRIHCSNVSEFETLSLELLREKLPKRFKPALDRDGQLPPAAGNQVVNALKDLRPGAVDLIDRLQEPVDAYFAPGESGEMLRQQADSVGLVFEIAMFDRGLLRSWSPPADGVPFLQGMPVDAVALEDHLVIHDSERFGNWVPVGVNQVAWRGFASGPRRLYVMNANRTSVENSLGVDLIYYNESRHSFVMVQYKKLTKEKESKSAKSSLGYRPDGNLAKEMKRMRDTDQKCVGSSGDFRLHETPSWLKLCDPSQEVRDLAKLIPGMYFARQHFEDLQNTCKGPRGGVRITYENSGRHISNTLFARLVSGGWIGTRGTSSDFVRDVVRESLETGRSVTLGVENGELPAQSPVVP